MAGYYLLKRKSCHEKSRTGIDDLLIVFTIILPAIQLAWNCQFSDTCFKIYVPDNANDDGNNSWRHHCTKICSPPLFLQNVLNSI